MEKNKEKFYALVHLIFTLAEVYFLSEVHTSRGRADSVFMLGDNVYCLELKLEGLAKGALLQIDQSGYFDHWKNYGKHLHKISINYYSQTR
ncbi:MAG: PD-(D/E)XK nuclease domain-containing protein [Thermaurantimonas sp.]|uniref:PD-(D/E)XK nuclease domain-containing protein n=1 Tax=Thermaurantimonas sp. TaxID=2681568 RepID=UPI00391C4F9F